MDDIPETSPVSNRLRLTPARIIEAAFALVDGEGLEAFSFRTLAARLNCQAMSLYHYFPSKAQLYEAMAGECLRELPPPAEGEWRVRIMQEALAYRGIALRHPGFFPYFTIFRHNNRVGMAYLDRILSVFVMTGLPSERRAFHFRVFGYFLSGAGMEEALGYAKGPSSADPVADDEARRDFPQITAVGRWFGRDHHEAIFHHGLAVMLDAIEADIARHHGA